MPLLGSIRALRRSALPCAILAGALVLLTALAGPRDAAGQDYIVPMQPFPIVRIVGEATRTGSLIKKLSIKGPAGVVVVTACKPSSKCPYKQRAQLIAGPQGGTRTVRIKALERRLRAGVTLRVFVATPGFIGKYTSFLIRRGKQPRRYDRCVKGVVLRAIRCPAS